MIVRNHVIRTTCAFQIAAYLNQPFSSLVRLGVALHVLIPFPCNHIPDKNSKSSGTIHFPVQAVSGHRPQCLQKGWRQKTDSILIVSDCESITLHIFWRSGAFDGVHFMLALWILYLKQTWIWVENGWAENHLWQTGWMQSTYRTSCLLPNNYQLNHMHR